MSPLVTAKKSASARQNPLLGTRRSAFSSVFALFAFFDFSH
jgi:hypothetical protein